MSKDDPGVLRKAPCGGACGGPKDVEYEPHPCPFQLEIHDNNEDYCTCCAECQQECAYDV